MIINNTDSIVDEATAIQLCQIFKIYKEGMDGSDCLVMLDSITSHCSHCLMPTYTINDTCADCKFPKGSLQQQEQSCNSCGSPSLFYGDGTCANCGV
jgi:ribosomal protein L37E